MRLRTMLVALFAVAIAVATFIGSGPVGLWPVPCPPPGCQQ